MWGANNANDCMKLHNTKKSFDFGYFAPSYNASVHSTYGIPACYAYVYSTEPQNFSPPNPLSTTQHQDKTKETQSFY